MRVPRLHTTQALLSGQNIALEEQASRHLVQVLRFKAGASIRLFNGNGKEFEATLIEAGKKGATIHVDAEINAENTESPLHIHLGIAISKGDRMDWLVQKCTELGVNEISPLLTERVDVKLPADRQAKKQQHWQQIAISGCEQSGRNTLPTINMPLKLSPWLDDVNAEKKLLLDFENEIKIADSNVCNSAALLVGPEGGLSELEVLLAKKMGFSGWRLGKRVLRTETAPLAAISVLQFCFGDF
jgi:16S rRNA (uracil1498-N3)-methyltransferase